MARYVGAIEKGQMHGHGEMNYPNGETYLGSWSYGKRHGKGIYTVSKIYFIEL
jgi:hypothetical protein